MIEDEQRYRVTIETIQVHASDSGRYSQSSHICAYLCIFAGRRRKLIGLGRGTEHATSLQR